jgi:hypothetical protein
MTKDFRRAFFSRLGASCLLLPSTLLGGPTPATATQLTGAYINPAYLTPWGSGSHWIQPWRAYMETVPASTFVDGTGINFNVDPQQAENVAEMLAKSGVHHARMGLEWGSFNYDHEDELDDKSIATRLLVLKRHGIRPLIVLNAHSGRPCPSRLFRRTVTKDAARGDRTIALDSVDGIVKDFSGLSNVGKDAGAARILIVGLDGNVATLSKPLSIDVAAGTTINIATLKYRPFSAPGSADFDATMKGWQRYALNVARIARDDLGTTGMPDGGFDLEIWNELTFGSWFLSIDNYYTPSSGSNPNKLIWGPIVAATAQTAESRPDLFSGVHIGDGFANTIPWPASSTEPARIDAIDKHPYKGQATFPAAEVKQDHLDATMRKDNFVPSYTTNFPEYWATSIRGDNILRDMAPVNSLVQRTIHGRYARTVDGAVKPVTVWITEVNNDPELDNPAVSDDAALAIKGKTTARYFTFYLNKGATQLDLYAVQDRNVQYKDKAMSIVRDSFLSYSDHAGAAYPTDDAPYMSPALLATQHIVAKMNLGLDRSFTRPRQLTLNSVTAKNDGVIFAGDGTASHPDLRAVDVFTFLPYQANAHRFVIPYYIMTRDVTKDWPEDLFTINVSGFSAKAHFSEYDPITNTTNAVTATAANTGTRLDLPAIDYPRLLIVDETP